MDVIQRSYRLFEHIDNSDFYLAREIIYEFSWRLITREIIHEYMYLIFLFIALLPTIAIADAPVAASLTSILNDANISLPTPSVAGKCVI